MAELTYRIDVVFGSVEMGRATGRWVQDPDGWWREVYTDTIRRDGDGREVSREPTIAACRISEPPPWGCAPLRRRPWWARLFRLAP